MEEDDLITSDTNYDSDDQPGPFSAPDSLSRDSELQRENASLKALVTTLKATTTALRVDVERLESLIQRQHEDHKVYYKAFKDKLSVADADKKLVPLRMSTPVNAFTSVPPTLRVPHLAVTSGKEKKKLVLRAVDEVCRTWLLAPQGARCHKNGIKIANAPPSKHILGINTLFIEQFQKIPDHESAISLLTVAENNSPPTTPRLASNHAIAARLFQDAVGQLEEDSQMMSYLFELSNDKFDSGNASFSSLQSMAWACLVSWSIQVKAAVEPSRKVLKPLSNSGATPVKDEADDPVEFFSVEAPNKSMGVKSVEVGKQTSFLWKKAQYVYVETADIEGAAVQNISNLAANKVLPKDLMAVLSSIEQGVNCGLLGIDTHEAKNPKDTSFEDVIHLLLFLSFCCPEDDDVLLKSCPSFLKMRFLCELVVLRLHFQRGDSKSFWDMWKFPPTPTSDYALCFEKLNLPPYYAKPTAKRVGAKIKLSTQAEQPPPPADVEETALVTTPAPASKKRSVMALHSGRSVRSKGTSRSQKEAAKDDE
ncbi:hypothetical protein HDU77_000673 [Chytriomyces hyalinus]|nr:hypothetical protein HDU77_000673 [Chytriomyces hyalinus]